MLSQNELTFEQVQVPIAGLHSALDGFKIVQLSDIHFLPFTPLMLVEKAIAIVGSRNPDLVVLTGDFVTHDPDTIFGIVAALGKLNATYGLFAVLGNHDVRTGARIVRQGLEEAGITILHNRGFTFNVGQGQLNLAGVDDCIWGHPDIKAALDNLSSHAPTLLLAHEPDVIDDFSKAGPIALQLSGHTHGGQVRLPLLGTPVLPKLGEKYIEGLHRVNGSWVYTNRGLGMVSMPIRFNCPPEITEITLCVADGTTL